MSRPLIEAMSHDLTLDIPPTPIFVDGDLTRLAQVFANLLNNAAKYTERGGRITLQVGRRGSDALVSVRDTGVGIPAHMLPKVFDVFTQVDHSLERLLGGLGIGLSLVKGLVELHGGGGEARSAGHGKGNDYNHRVLEAFFVESQDIGSIDVLTRLAGEVGLNEKEFEEALRARKYREAHRLALRHAYEEVGVTGVPMFVIGDRVLTGLQDRKTLEAVIEEEAAASKEG